MESKRQSMPLISVVIATYKRRDVLKVTLKKLASQSIPSEKYEVLVVDDGSDDRTSDMVESMRLTFPYKLRYYWHENRGPGYTQNRGIREAQSDLVLLIADDIWATSRLLEQHIKVHLEHPEKNIAVLGEVRQSVELPKTVIHKYWNAFQFEKFKGKSEVPGIYFYACNISVKKKFMLANGMYKEIKGSFHEDVELGYRLSQKGLHILHNEHALAYHFHEETLDAACKRAYGRGLNFDILSENIPKSYIFPVYKIATLEAGFIVFLKMLPREIIRKCLFNKWSVNGFWLPMLKRAEHSSIAAIFANGLVYRASISHFLREGYKEYRNRKKNMRVTKKLVSL